MCCEAASDHRSRRAAQNISEDAAARGWVLWDGPDPDLLPSVHVWWCERRLMPLGEVTGGSGVEPHELMALLGRPRKLAFSKGFRKPKRKPEGPQHFEFPEVSRAEPEGVWCSICFSQGLSNLRLGAALGWPSRVCRLRLFACRSRGVRIGL